VRSGAVQVGLDLGLSALPGLVSAARAGSIPLRVKPVTGSGAEVLMFNLCASSRGLCDNPAEHENEDTADATIRRAILLGIDRAAIVAAIAPGMTTVPRDSWMSLGASYLTGSNVPSTAYDLGQANAVLDAGGDARTAKCGAAPDGQDYRALTDGTCIVVNLGTTSDDPARVAIESMVKTDLARIGINVPTPFEPNIPAASFFGSFAAGGPLATHAFDMALYTVGLGTPGEPDTYSSTWHGDCGGACPSAAEIPSSADLGTGTNFSGLSDTQLDSALDLGRNTADLAQRAHDYALADQRLAAVLPAIPLFQEVIVNTYSTSVFGVTQNDLVPDFDTAAWYCAAGNCAG
jgi:ABC-type transport system substrate-binding protein